jgi:hypothetical protein
MTFYLRRGNTYQVTDEANINLHTELPVGNYVVKQDMFGNFILEQIDSFSPPKKIYGSVLSKANRILSTYLDRAQSTGVMLAGEKGSGKTLLSKHLSILAAEKEIPTIVINNPWHGDEFNQFMQDVSQPCIVLFDEFEKVYNREHQEAILTLLDGVFPSKKLFIFTCNDHWRIDTNMRNRPGRIYYMIEFRGLDTSFIEEYCLDNLIDKHYIDTICKITSLFSKFNFDMLKALVEEMNRYRESPQDAMSMLNAKPEFSEKLDYTMQLLLNGIPVNELNPDTWTGNPISDEIRIGYHLENPNKLVENDEDQYWIDVEFTPSDLINVDSNSGSFVFTDKEKKLTLLLTKKLSSTANYLNLF